MERKVINRKHFSFWSLKNRTFSVLSPLACFQCADRDFRAVGNGILWLTPCKLACERSLELKSDIAVSVGDGRSW